jgi:hypothetical protein
MYKSQNSSLRNILSILFSNICYVLWFQSTWDTAFQINRQITAWVQNLTSKLSEWPIWQILSNTSFSNHHITRRRYHREVIHKKHGNVCVVRNPGDSVSYVLPFKRHEEVDGFWWCQNAEHCLVNYKGESACLVHVSPLTSSARLPLNAA